MPNDMIALLEMCILNVQFLFNEKYYFQIEGVAMGSPLGPVLANIFIGYIETRSFDLIKSETRFFCRYMDDCFVIGKNKNSIPKLANVLSNVDVNIKYTYEFEDEEGKIPFLDVLVHRGRSFLETGWYHKTTWSKQVLNFFSFVPLAQKIAILKYFKHRMLKICSENQLTAAMNELNEIFRLNGYPCEIIDEYNPFTKAINKKNIYINLPFLGDEKSFVLKKNKNFV